MEIGSEGGGVAGSGNARPGERHVLAYVASLNHRPKCPDRCPSLEPHSQLKTTEGSKIVSCFDVLQNEFFLGLGMLMLGCEIRIDFQTPWSL